MINGKFVVISYNPISGYERKLLTKLYMPFIGKEAAQLFTYLHDLIPGDEIESVPFQQTKIFVELGIRTFEDLEVIKSRLEACALMSTFEKDDLTIYELHDVLRPVEFFKDPLLSTMLKQSIGNIEFEGLQSNYLITRYDLSTFQNVTKSFDDVFSADCYEESQFDSSIKLIKSIRPRLNDYHLDYEIISDSLKQRDLYDVATIASVNFYNAVNTAAFCFSLNTDEILECLIKAASIDKEFKESKFITQCKRIYNKKFAKSSSKSNLKLKKELSKDNELIKKLSEAEYNEFVERKYGKALTGSEVQVLNNLIRTYGYSKDFVFVLLLYVLENTNGSFPTLNYFVKVATDWNRQGIKTVEQALEHISKMGKDKPTYKKKQVSVPDWVKEEEEAKKKPKIEPVKKEEDPNTLKELEDFFGDDLI